MPGLDGHGHLILQAQAKVTQDLWSLSAQALDPSPMIMCQYVECCTLKHVLMSTVKKEVTAPAAVNQAASNVVTARQICGTDSPQVRVLSNQSVQIAVGQVTPLP